MCYLVAHDKIQPAYEDDGRSIGYRSIPKYATKKHQKHWLPLLILLIYGFNFFDYYDARCEAYINAMKEMFNQIPQTMIKKHTTKQKFQKVLTDIGGGWYI